MAIELTFRNFFQKKKRPFTGALTPKTTPLIRTPPCSSAFLRLACVTWLIQMCAMTYVFLTWLGQQMPWFPLDPARCWGSQVWSDPPRCVPWRYVCDSDNNCHKAPLLSVLLRFARVNDPSRCVPWRCMCDSDNNCHNAPLLACCWGSHVWHDPSRCVSWWYVWLREQLL